MLLALVINSLSWQFPYMTLREQIYPLLAIIFFIIRNSIKRAETRWKQQAQLFVIRLRK